MTEIKYLRFEPTDRAADDCAVRVVDAPFPGMLGLIECMAAVDICEALGYSEPRTAWAKLKDRNPELDANRTVTKLVADDGKLRDTDVLTLDGVIRLCMLSKGPRAEAFRDWAVKVLRREMESPRDFAMPALDSSFMQAIADKMRALETQVAELAPKAETYDALTSSPDTLSVGEAAKVIGVGPNWLFSKLRADGVFQNHPHRNIPYANDENRKRFVVIESPWTDPKTGEKRVTLVVRVTQYGLAWMQRKYGSPVTNWKAEYPNLIGRGAQ